MNQKVIITSLNIATLPTLNKEETLQLLNDYQNNDKTAKDKIILGNLKLVLKAIKKINYPSNIDSDDLFQIGIIGLIKAVDNFNLNYNVVFSTYAMPMIIGEIKRYLRDNCNVKISRQIKDLAYKILKLKEEYLHKYNKEISIEEMAKILNEDVFSINEALNSLNCVVSLEDPIYVDNGETLLYEDQLANNENIKEEIVNSITLKNGLAKLKKTEQDIIYKRYFEEQTQEEIAKEMMISQAQVSRMEKNAINNLKKLF